LRLRGIEGCELCADDRPETIAAALERVLRDPRRIEGRVVVQELDERLLAARVVGLYRSILRREPERHAAAAAGRSGSMSRALPPVDEVSSSW
jgi:hypothetical protein